MRLTGFGFQMLHWRSARPRLSTWCDQSAVTRCSFIILIVARHHHHYHRHQQWQQRLISGVITGSCAIDAERSIQPVAGRADSDAVAITMATRDAIRRHRTVLTAVDYCITAVTLFSERTDRSILTELRLISHEQDLTQSSNDFSPCFSFEQKSFDLLRWGVFFQNKALLQGHCTVDSYCGVVMPWREDLDFTLPKWLRGPSHAIAAKASIANASHVHRNSKPCFFR